MAKLTKQEIQQIASLARLALEDEEQRRYAIELATGLGYVETLGKVDTQNVKETCQVTGLEDVVRDDVAYPCDPVIQEKLRAQFPKRVGDLLQVHAVFVDSSL